MLQMYCVSGMAPALYYWTESWCLFPSHLFCLFVSPQHCALITARIWCVQLSAVRTRNCHNFVQILSLTIMVCHLIYRKVFLLCNIRRSQVCLFPVYWVSQLRAQVWISAPLLYGGCYLSKAHSPSSAQLASQTDEKQSSPRNFSKPELRFHLPITWTIPFQLH